MTNAHRRLARSLCPTALFALLASVPIGPAIAEGDEAAELVRRLRSEVQKAEEGAARFETESSARWKEAEEKEQLARNHAEFSKQLAVESFEAFTAANPPSLGSLDEMVGKLVKQMASYQKAVARLAAVRDLAETRRSEACGSQAPLGTQAATHRAEDEQVRPRPDYESSLQDSREQLFQAVRSVRTERELAAAQAADAKSLVAGLRDPVLVALKVQREISQRFADALSVKKQVEGIEESLRTSAELGAREAFVLGGAISERLRPHRDRAGVQEAIGDLSGRSRAVYIVYQGVLKRLDKEPFVKPLSEKIRGVEAFLRPRGFIVPPDYLERIKPLADRIESAAAEIDPMSEKAASAQEAARQAIEEGERCLDFLAEAEHDPLIDDARVALESCDYGRVERILAGLDAGAVKDLLTRDLAEARTSEADVERRLASIEQKAERVFAECMWEEAEWLLAGLEQIDPCAEERRSRRDRLAERLRFFIEQGADAEGDDLLLEQVREAFNKAVHGANYGCDMTTPRQHLETARTILTRLEISECRSPFLYDFEQLKNHGVFVEETIVEREARMKAIRDNVTAADAALSSGLATCRQNDLGRAAAGAAHALGVADSLPFMTGAGCDEIRALLAEAKDIEAEAGALRSNWSSVDGELARARRSAADGRSADVDAACGGLRRLAQPAKCFSAQLDECARLRGMVGVSPFGQTSTAPTAPPQPQPGQSGGGGGSGRVQILESEPCALDMSWAPARQRFECTCAGYRFDEARERCVPGAAPTAAAQVDCSQWKGTIPGVDASGQPACVCPDAARPVWAPGNPAMGIAPGCRELPGGGGGLGTAAPGTASGAYRDCQRERPGTFFDVRTGRCECPLGTWQDGRCVDTGVAERQREIDAASAAGDCTFFLTQVRMAGPQFAAAAAAQARSLGCDTGQIDQAVADGARRRAARPGTGGGGEPATERPGAPTLSDRTKELIRAGTVGAGGTSGQSGGGQATGSTASAGCVRAPDVQPIPQGTLYEIAIRPYGAGATCMSAAEAQEVRNDPNLTHFKTIGDSCPLHCPEGFVPNRYQGEDKCVRCPDGKRYQNDCCR